MTHLRQLMLDELQRRNYSPATVRSYIHAVEEFATYFHRSPEQLGPEHIRDYQVHLFRDRKLSPRTIEGQAAALRFLFVKTLGRPYLPDVIPFPKHHRRLPRVLSQEEVSRLIDSTGNLMHRAMVMTLYATGVRRAELCRLKVADIDSERMVLHIQQGKGGRDRDVPLSPRLLETLREYWRWMKPKTYLSQACRTTGELMCRSPIRWHGSPSPKPPRPPALPSASHRTRFGTATRRICSKPVPTCARSSFCSDMPSSPIPRSTCIYRAVTCRPSPVRSKRSSSRRRTRRSL